MERVILYVFRPLNSVKSSANTRADVLRLLVNSPRNIKKTPLSGLLSPIVLFRTTRWMANVASSPKMLCGRKSSTTGVGEDVNVGEGLKVGEGLNVGEAVAVTRLVTSRVMVVELDEGPPDSVAIMQQPSPRNITLRMTDSFTLDEGFFLA